MKSFFTLFAILLVPLATLAASPKPNVIYLIDDELGYYEPGFMGGGTSRLPTIDRMAAEGIVFRNLFAGGSVCAPTRCCLLTGKHSGHTSVRSNGGGTPLRAEEQGQWRAVRPKPNQPWELYDLATDPSETSSLAAAQPALLGKLMELAMKAHEPVRQGTFTTTERHERDRRAKFGRQDEPAAPKTIRETKAAQ